METSTKQPVVPNDGPKTSGKVSLKTALAITGTYAAVGLFAAFPFLNQQPLDAFNAALIGETLGESVHAAAPVAETVPLLTNNFVGLLIAIAGIFLTIFTLYVFAKAEGQDHGDKFHKNACKFAYQNFPSIVVIEALTMLYVMLITIACVLMILKVSYSDVDMLSAMETDVFNIMSSIIFAILGGAMSQLYYFLNKVRPEDVLEEREKGTQAREVLEFDVNRTLRYLSFPIMSAGMGIMAYTLIKGAGLILGIAAFQNPSYWAIVFVALTAGYFSELFTVMFQKIINRMEDKILNGKAKA